MCDPVPWIAASVAGVPCLRVARLRALPEPVPAEAAGASRRRARRVGVCRSLLFLSLGGCTRDHEGVVVSGVEAHEDGILWRGLAAGAVCMRVLAELGREVGGKRLAICHQEVPRDTCGEGKSPHA